ncbi:DnaD domain protein [Macrococcus capreoli]|uniref:DnaD domain protein n=1 Tax=Macrococcus capreoli TaxID=2982690 RepID=UPI0021D5FDEF|nr:DnaD domain protein [Macrococcus sp. TMW 2.2395]MCU7557283.1 DnaD domain protein [Macrococcus sp. TMW 2.2395]
MTNDNNVIKSNITGYGLVFKNVMIDKSIDIEAKALYAFLSAYAGSSESAYPSVELICGQLNISEKRFKKYRKQLEDAGYLTIERHRTTNGFSNNVYTIHHESVSGQIVTVTNNTDNTSVSGQIVTEQIVTGQNVSKQFVSEQNVGTKNNSLKNNSLKNNNIKNNTTTNNTLEVAAVETDEFKKLYSFFEQNINMHQAIKVVNFITDDLAKFGFDLVMYAMEQALLNNKTHYGYIQGVLRRCESENVTTREQAEHKARQKRNSYNTQSKEVTPAWVADEYHPGTTLKKDDMTPEELDAYRKKVQSELSNLWKDDEKHA